MQPISIHGQLSYDVHYTFADEPDGQARVARIGPEALAPGLQVGDKIRLDVANATLDVVADPYEFAARAQGFTPPAPRYTTGVLAKYR